MLRRALLALLAAFPMVSQTAPPKTAPPKTVEANDVWFLILDALAKAPDPAHVYGNNLKDALVPGMGKHWRGTVVSDASQDNPGELLIAISNAKTPEVKLRIRQREVGELRAGDEIEFNGIVRDVQWDPFLMTIACGEEEYFRARSTAR